MDYIYGPQLLVAVFYCQIPLLMNELTYILGAGASYQSIPIVKTFSNRFNEFVQSISQSFLNDVEIAKEESKKVFQAQLEQFQLEIKSHYSFDTYFKKLYHTSSEEKIIVAKKILNLYFLWEHFQIPTGFKQNTDSRGNDLTTNVDVNDFTKQSQLDKRYDALIAGLIKPIKGEINFFTKVNFISWNYDLNLFLSLKNFLSGDSTLGNYLSEISSEGSNTWKCGKDINVVNMNGFFYSEWLKGLHTFDFRNSNKVFKDFFSNGYDIEKNILDADAQNINFAWDNDSNLDNEDKIVKAVNTIARSKTIIVIGYTFPLYNRLVDLKYFNANQLVGKKLIIQDPNAEQIEKDIIANFSIGQGYKGAVNIVLKTNCDNFFIPNNVFDFDDSVRSL